MGHATARQAGVNLEFLNMDSHDLGELEEIFTEDEVWNAIKEMPADCAPGPDGFIGPFYQHAWHIIKHDIMAVMYKLYIGEGRGFGKLNRAHIILIPKDQMQRKWVTFGR